MLSNFSAIKTPLIGIVFCLGLQLQVADVPSNKTAETPSKHRKETSFDLGGGVKLEMVPIEASSFTMGDDRGESEEKPPHKITISKPFLMGKFEITQEQWEAVMGGNSSRFKGARNPVDRVSWEDCQAFVKKLNEKFADSKTTFSLPSEAQWEYACRAGTATPYSFGDKPADLDEYAWFEDNAGGKTHPVGEKKPNAWGLYDMYGNVWEWTADRFDGNYYKISDANDPAGPADGVAYSLRGGSWSDSAFYCRSTYRFCLPPWFRVHCYGLRVICH